MSRGFSVAARLLVGPTVLSGNIGSTDSVVDNSGRLIPGVVSNNSGNAGAVVFSWGKVEAQAPNSSGKIIELEVVPGKKSNSKVSVVV
jgi:hypothetical protein